MLARAWMSEGKFPYHLKGLKFQNFVITIEMKIFLKKKS